MIGGQNIELPLPKSTQTTSRPRHRAAALYRLVSRLFARDAVSEAVMTQIHFNASPEEVWNQIMFYEEVPGRPPFLLRILLTDPIRTEGDKTRVGATVRCTYTGGDLVKRITTVASPHFLQFNVLEQFLGIEGCILALGGSYQIHACGEATDVVLITNYRAYLRPRCLWRRVEAILLSQLHNHILGGIRAAVLPGLSYASGVVASPTAPCTPPGGLACTVSQSYSRR